MSDDIKALKEALDEVRRNDGDEKSWPVWDGACTPSRIARVLERLEAAEALVVQARSALIPLSNAHLLIEREQITDEDVTAADVSIRAIDAAMKKEPQQ